MRGTTSVFAGQAALLAVLALGCGRQAIVSTDALPVRRVVVYRNGVAYFERAGHVEREVRFKMKRGEVGDFLATLAVMERGGSSVRAAAFPLRPDDDDESADGEGDVEGDGDAGDDKEGRGEAKPKRVKSEDEKKGLETVVLSLDGKAHDLQVGYVAPSPVWRPSYRLVVHGSQGADLQAWGIVQNLSGEDWKDVKLSLIAGAPLAFQADLANQTIPPRPTVTDEGELIAVVPHSETSLGQHPPEAPAAPPPAPAAPAAEAALEDEASEGAGGGPRDRNRAAAGNAGRARPKKSAVVPAPAGAPPAPGTARYGYKFEESPLAAGNFEPNGGRAPAISGPRDLRSLAAVAVEGGSTRYDLPNEVTVPDRSATMVLLLSRAVPGETVYLFAPEDGIPDSSSHPFRVARFVNDAGGTLERGPIAVFEEGAFLGQGMVDPLPPGATATVPFALERAIGIDLDRSGDELGERVAKIENGELTVERDVVNRTKYRVRNGGDAPAKVIVKHRRVGGARLFEPPAGTEDNVGTGTALVPATVPARATASLVVDERVTVRRPADWFSEIAGNAVKAYLADPKADRAAVQKLTAAWAPREDIVKKSAERAKLQREQATLSQSTEETRRNLRAIEKNPTAEALRQKLTARLAESSTKLDDLNRRIVELDAKVAELEVQFKEGVREIVVQVPPAS